MLENAPAPYSASVTQLFREIKDIFEQYKREVPRKRGPWPQAIQSRVLELWKLGISTHQISSGTALSCQTMYSWRQRLRKQVPGGFLPVPIATRRSHRSNGRTANGETRGQHLSPSYSHGRTTTVVITIGDDIRLEGVPISEVATLLREVRQR